MNDSVIFEHPHADGEAGEVSTPLLELHSETVLQHSPQQLK